MVLKIPLQPLPEIREVYKIKRKTVWRSADNRSILVFIDDGECQIELDGQRYILRTGDVFLIPPGKEYRRLPIRDQYCSLIYVHFTTDAPMSPISFDDAERELREEMAKITDLSAQKRTPHLPSHLYLMQYTATGEDFERLSALICQIFARRNMEPYIAPLLVSFCFTEFLANISLNIAFATPNGSINRELPFVLRQALSYIQQNYDKKLSTEDICAYCHISPQHLIRLFKKHFGVTPLQYITKNKTSHAIELLRNSELSIKEIAYALGYENPNYFSRLFNKEEGYSPSEIRERIQNYRDDGGALREN